MGSGAMIVDLSVWLALLCFPAMAIGRAVESTGAQRWARLVWSVGCAWFWLHVLSAFHVFYAWSHSVAITETAAQTLATTGVDSGAGLYLNYLFAMLWTLDVAWWWWRPEGYRARPLAVFLALQGFFLFMISNGAVIFVDGPRRWLGVMVTMAAIVALGWAVSRARQQVTP